MLHLIWDIAPETWCLREERHKSVVRGGAVLRTGCWEDRTAWKLFSADNAEEIKAYGYLACGTVHQPKHTYALAFKRMCPALADRLYALGLFATNGSFVPETLVLHPDTGRSPQEKGELRKARTDSIQNNLNAMQRQSSVADL